jgi:hypothetical protein
LPDRRSRDGRKDRTRVAVNPGVVCTNGGA